MPYRGKQSFDHVDLDVGAQEYYDATVKHRKLQWYYHHGIAMLRGNFRSKPIDITASTTQAAVLLLFNAGTLRNHLSSPCPLSDCASS